MVTFGHHSVRSTDWCPRHHYRWKGGRPVEQLRIEDVLDHRPGPAPGAGAHRLLEGEKERIKQAAREDRHKDLRHRKLCHRISRDQLVHVSESSVYRVLKAEDMMGPAVLVGKKRLRPETDCAEGRKSALRAETRPEGR